MQVDLDNPLIDLTINRNRFADLDLFHLHHHHHHRRHHHNHHPVHFIYIYYHEKSGGCSFKIGQVMISFIFIIIIVIIIIIIIIIIVMIIIMYVSFRSITMQNLEVVASKLAELWPFNDFSKIITDSLTD